MVERAAYFSAIAKPKRIQVIPTFDERPLGWCRDCVAAVDGRHPEPVVNLTDGPVLAGDRVQDLLVSCQATIPAKHYPLRRHAGVHLLLKLHGLVQPERFDLPTLQLRLDLFEVAKRVLGHAGDDRRLRMVRDLPRVRLH